MDDIHEFNNTAILKKLQQLYKNHGIKGLTITKLRLETKGIYYKYTKNKAITKLDNENKIFTDDIGFKFKPKSCPLYLHASC